MKVECIQLPQPLGLRSLRKIQSTCSNLHDALKKKFMQENTAAYEALNEFYLEVSEHVLYETLCTYHLVIIALSIVVK